MGLVVVVASGLVWRAVDLQLLTRDFLQDHGDARHLREVEIPAHRTMIADRNGEPLAISTIVKSVWAVPSQVITQRHRWKELAGMLDTTVAHLDALITPRAKREFLYLKRHVEPELARRIVDANIAGVALQDEYKRYYPSGEITGHVLGFTNVDDDGQEGVELAFDEQLRGHSGRKRVIRDRLGRIVEDVEEIRPVVPGVPVVLSIDRRLQYIAYRELKAAIAKHHARAGSVVIIDPLTGEVLAMVNQPSFNPNNRTTTRPAVYRNRAVTDLFEPGSPIKAFTIAAALESGQFKPEVKINTSPGYFMVGRDKVQDINNYGVLDLGGIIEKSSNVGAAKVALAMEPENLYSMLSRAGFGAPLLTGFPGEATGKLAPPENWREIEHATLSFGYGLSVTPLHLAHAFGAIANDGVIRPVTMLRQDTAPAGERIMSAKTARTVREMMVRVVESGTAKAAHVPGFRVAGKTGTVHKSTESGYAEDRYVSIFTGMLPATSPRLVAVIMVDEPTPDEHFGGQVAAPVFAGIMLEAVRILNIPGDAEFPPATEYFAELKARAPAAIAEVAQ
ncbi:MAG: penicillin-binding protein 2 [Gammaproteobacteria bacterium]|nr:penicillin-binding protein 2 [Gammaproteobacteria bacterium]